MKELPPNQPSQSIKISDSVLENVQIAQAGRDLNLTQIQGEVGSLTVFGTVQVAQASPEVAKPISREEYRRRKVLLGRVKQDWIEGVLKGALHTKVLIELGLEGRKDLINNPASEAEEFRFDQREVFSEEASAISIFEDIGAGRTLLILGEPGAGKTVTLLKLAESLVSRAESDLSQPLPVVMNLSSWAKQRLPMNKWLVQELSEKYHVSKPLGQTWIEQEQLLLLLDGLDEVDINHRNDCVKSLNNFILEHGLTEIVVCSRIQDYQALPERLRLRSAIHVKPLNLNQINHFLDQVGESLSSLKIALRNNMELQSFVSSPLILSIMSLAYKGYSVEALTQNQTIEEQRRKLFDTYIDRMFSRRGTTYQYSRQKTLDWLTWMAKEMIFSSQSIFLIEQLQPNLLSSRSHRLSYRFLSNFLSAITIGSLLGIFAGIVELIIHSQNTDITIQNIFITLILGPILIVFAALIFGLIYTFIFASVDAILTLPIAKNSDFIKPLNTLKWSWKKALNSGSITLINVTFISSVILTIFFAFQLLYDPNMSTFSLGDINKYGAFGKTLVILIFGSTFSVLGGLIFGRKSRERKKEIGIVKKWSWKNSSLGLTSGILFAVILMIFESFQPYLTVGLSIPTVMGSLYGCFLGFSLAIFIFSVTWGAEKTIAIAKKNQKSKLYKLERLSEFPRDESKSNLLLHLVFSGALTGLLGGFLGSGFWLVFDPEHARNFIGEINASRFDFERLLFSLRLGSYIGIPLSIVSGLLGTRFSIFFSKKNWSWRKYKSGSIYGAIIGLLAGSCFCLFPGLTEAIFVTMIIVPILGLAFGFAAAPIAILLGGFMRKKVSPGNNPNQAIWGSAKASVIGIFIGMTFGLLTYLLAPVYVSSAYEVNLDNTELRGVLGGVLLGLVFYSPILGLYFGGAACSKHISLRILLTYQGKMPWQYSRFLDYAVDRLFMQKVGGGYVFVHRMLLEHFAEIKLK